MTSIDCPHAKIEINKPQFLEDGITNNPDRIPIPDRVIILSEEDSKYKIVLRLCPSCLQLIRTELSK